MAAIALERADLSLFSDPIGSRVEIPYLTAFVPQVTLPVALPQFEGRDYPSAVRGTTKSRTMRVECIFPDSMHDRALALEQLILRAHYEDVTGHLVLRTNAGQVGGLDPLEVVAVTGYVPTPMVGLSRTLSFDAVRVAYSLGV